MENKDEQLIAEFLAPAKREIPDNGFSRRVMHRLPDRSYLIARVWSTCGFVLAAVLFVALGGVQRLIDWAVQGVEGWLQSGVLEQADPKSLLVAALVLVCIGCSKVVSFTKKLA